MSKFLRKITAVVLAIVLVSLCGINAFAYTFSEDYDNDRYVVTVTANIYQYSTSGSIWIQDKNSQEGFLKNQYRSVSVSCNYLVLVGVNAVQLTATASDTAQSGDYMASVTISKPDCYHMVSATYTFEADVPCSYGTQEFRTDPISVIYNP